MDFQRDGVLEADDRVVVVGEDTQGNHAGSTTTKAATYVGASRWRSVAIAACWDVY